MTTDTITINSVPMFRALQSIANGARWWLGHHASNMRTIQITPDGRGIATDGYRLMIVHGLFCADPDRLTQTISVEEELPLYAREVRIVGQTVNFMLGKTAKNFELGPVAGKFPNWSPIITGEFRDAPTSRVCFNPEYIGEIATLLKSRLVKFYRLKRTSGKGQKDEQPFRVEFDLLGIKENEVLKHEYYLMPIV